MKQLLILFLSLIALSVSAQDSVYHKSYLAQPVYRPGQVIPAKAVNQLVDVEIPAGKAYKLVEVAYDSSWVITEYNNNSSAIVYSGPWKMLGGQSKFTNGDYHYGDPVGARTAVFTYTTDKPAVARFWSERYSGHGKYMISVDGGTPLEINAGVTPLLSDKERNLASWKTPLLPAGTHKITITSSAQMVVDRFTVAVLTVVPR